MALAAADLLGGGGGGRSGERELWLHMLDLMALGAFNCQFLLPLTCL